MAAQIPHSFGSPTSHSVTTPTTTLGAAYSGFVRGQGLEVSNGASGANRARLKFATAANVDLTLPGVLPSVGNTSILGVDGNGLISSAPSLNTDITFTGTATVRHGTYSYVDQLTGNKVSILVPVSLEPMRAVR